MIYMISYSEIPTHPWLPFREQLMIQGLKYTLRFQWNKRSNCWVMEFWDAGNTFKILTGIPLVTGCDLLEQFQYLPLGVNAILTVMTIGPSLSPDTVPSVDNLGIDAHLYLTTAS